MKEGRKEGRKTKKAAVKKSKDPKKIKIKNDKTIFRGFVCVRVSLCGS